LAVAAVAAVAVVLPRAYWNQGLKVLILEERQALAAALGLTLILAGLLG
jgi:hypothetical protein